MSCQVLKRLNEHDDILERAQESVRELVSEGVRLPDSLNQYIQELRDRLAERRLALIRECPEASPQEAKTA